MKSVPGRDDHLEIFVPAKSISRSASSTVTVTVSLAVKSAGSRVKVRLSLVVGVTFCVPLLPPTTATVPLMLTASLNVTVMGTSTAWLVALLAGLVTARRYPNVPPGPGAAALAVKVPVVVPVAPEPTTTSRQEGTLYPSTLPKHTL